MTRYTFHLISVALLGFGLPACVAAQDAGNEPYVASSRGQVYYWVECEAWHTLAPESLRWFATAEDAVAAGYRPSGARGCAGPSATAARGPVVAGVCTIDRVVDGDTVACREAGERVRLLMIDAPEIDQGPFGGQAKRALERLLPPGSLARLELDVQERDRYGRILAYLYGADDRMINETMALEGFGVALVIAPNVRHAERIRAAVADARRAGRGLWSGRAFECPPADHRANRC